MNHAYFLLAPLECLQNKALQTCTPLLGTHEIDLQHERHTCIAWSTSDISTLSSLLLGLTTPLCSCCSIWESLSRTAWFTANWLAGCACRACACRACTCSLPQVVHVKVLMTASEHLQSHFGQACCRRPLMSVHKCFEEARPWVM